MAMQIGKDLSELIQNGHQETAIMRVRRYICFVIFVGTNYEMSKP